MLSFQTDEISIFRRIELYFFTYNFTYSNFKSFCLFDKNPSQKLYEHLMSYELGVLFQFIFLSYLVSISTLQVCKLVTEITLT